MVVDGQAQFVGSNFGQARQAIAEAVKNEKANIEISNDVNNLKVNISELPPHENSYVWLAIAENNLRTNVRRGENSGRTLEHVSVVRDLKLLGELAPTAKTFASETAWQIQPNWNKKNLKFVVFVQGKETKKVYGVSQKNL